MKYLLSSLYIIIGTQIQGQIYTFESRLYDHEKNGQVIQTYTSPSYHTFDYDNSRITLELKDSNVIDPILLPIVSGISLSKVDATLSEFICR